MQIDVTAPPSWEAVSVPEAREHCRIDGPDSDPLLGELIRRARATFESMTRSVLIETGFETWLDGFPACNSPLRPPRGPLLGLPDDAVAVLDPAGTLITTPPTALVMRAGHILLQAGQSWPIPGVQWLGCRLRWRAGLAREPGEVPPGAKLGLLQLVAHWYEHREAVIIGNSGEYQPLPYGVDLLWRPFRLLQL